VTFLELIATAAILAILASAVLPLGRVAVKRQKELELRRALRQIRTAIDEFHSAAEAQRIGGPDLELGSEGYPADLEMLVEGVPEVGQLDRKLKFLRRVPRDPMTGEAEWGQRCYQDEADSRSWCGDNVWDVYSLSRGEALDGTEYREW
jgi:general secretion pathway protein G